MLKLEPFAMLGSKEGGLSLTLIGVGRGGCFAAIGLDAVCVIAGTVAAVAFSALLAELALTAVFGAPADSGLFAELALVCVLFVPAEGTDGVDLRTALLDLAIGAEAGAGADGVSGNGDLLRSRVLLPLLGAAFSLSVLRGCVAAGEGAREIASCLTNGNWAAFPACSAVVSCEGATPREYIANSCSAPRVSGETLLALALGSAAAGASTCMPSCPSTSVRPFCCGFDVVSSICAFQPSISGGSPSDIALSSRCRGALAGGSAVSALPLPLASAEAVAVGRAGPRSRSGLGSIEVSEEESEKSKRF